MRRATRGLLLVVVVAWTSQPPRAPAASTLVAGQIARAGGSRWRRPVRRVPCRCCSDQSDAHCAAGHRQLEPLLVVLDLDETLVHASLLGGPPEAWLLASELSGVTREEAAAAWPPAWLPSRVSQPTLDFEAQGQGLITGLWEELPLFVSIRPGAREFVAWLLQRSEVEVAVYTAGAEPYAVQALAQLGLPQGGAAASVVLFRNETVPFGLPLTKDLTKFRQDLSRVVLVDNGKNNFMLQPANGILVSDWKGQNPEDVELDRVKRILEQLEGAADVRDVLRDFHQEAALDDKAAEEESVPMLPFALALVLGIVAAVGWAQLASAPD